MLFFIFISSSKQITFFLIFSTYSIAIRTFNRMKGVFTRIYLKFKVFYLKLIFLNHFNAFILMKNFKK